MIQARRGESSVASAVSGTIRNEVFQMILEVQHRGLAGLRCGNTFKAVNFRQCLFGKALTSKHFLSLKSDHDYNRGETTLC